MSQKSATYLRCPRSRLQPTGPPSAAALEQLVWRLSPEKQVPGQHKRALPPRSWAQPQVSPQGDWVLGHVSVGPGVEWLREQVILGLVLGLVCGQRV